MRDGNLVRLVYFAHRQTAQAVPATVRQITFTDIAEFIVSVRAPCWRDQGLGARSKHPQWDPMIKRVWEIGNPESTERPEIKIQRILECVDAEQRDSGQAE